MIALPPSFYTDADVVEIAQSLLGKYLHKRMASGKESVLKIVETEAYRAPEDKACHARGNLKTKRTATLFMPGGHWYVYLCYGIHHLLNVVTGEEGEAHAVLIRAVEPVIIHEIDSKKAAKTNGPGKFTKTLGIDLQYNSKKIAPSNGLYITHGEEIQASKILSSKRIGVDYAEEWAEVPWRFYIKNNAFVSR